MWIRREVGGKKSKWSKYVVCGRSGGEKKSVEQDEKEKTEGDWRKEESRGWWRPEGMWLSLLYHENKSTNRGNAHRTVVFPSEKVAQGAMLGKRDTHTLYHEGKGKKGGRGKEKLL